MSCRFSDAAIKSGKCGGVHANIGIPIAENRVA
jgi:hypothetical protein